MDKSVIDCTDVQPCPFCNDAWKYISEENGYRMQCDCGFAWKATKWTQDVNELVATWNSLVEERNKLLEDVRAIIRKYRDYERETNAPAD